MIILTKCQRYTMMTMLHHIPWFSIDRKAVLVLQTIPLCYCALWAYVSCHVYSVCCFSNSQKRQASQRSLFDSGELAVTSLSHRRASRLWVWLYTSVKLGSMLVYRSMLLRDFDFTPTNVGVRDTCPGDTLVSDTLVSLKERGGKTRKKRERVG